MSIEALSAATAAPARLDGLGSDAGSTAHGDSFARLLAQAPGEGGTRPADTPAPFLGGAPAGLGEEVVAGLRRFGRTVGKMEDIGAFKKRAIPGAEALPGGAPQPPVLPGPAELDPKSIRRPPSGQEVIGQAMDMARDSLGQQAQLYRVMMDFTLVHSSAESLNKSLKTLLTQGGG